MKFKLTIWLKDGRKLTGSYPLLPALARLEISAKHPNFKDFHMERE